MTNKFIALPKFPPCDTQFSIFYIHHDLSPHLKYKNSLNFQDAVLYSQTAIRFAFFLKRNITFNKIPQNIRCLHIATKAFRQNKHIPIFCSQNNIIILFCSPPIMFRCSLHKYIFLKKKPI